METAPTNANTQRGIKVTIAVILIFITLVMIGFINKITTPRSLSEMELRINGAFQFDAPRAFKPFDLVDHKNQAFTKANFEGQWSLVFFGFTHCPDVCPTTMATLSKLVKNLDDETQADTQVVLVSVDPARDTPDVLAEYVPFFSPDFIGVTGEFIGIKLFANQLNVAFAKVVTNAETGAYTVDHGATVALINPRGDYHAFFKPPLDPARMKLTYISMRESFAQQYGD
jgi:protein SCO1/2